MNNSELLTAEKFAETRPDLPECGRWIELVAGELVHLDPPDDLHGNVVLNLSKVLAEHLHHPECADLGYLCFELGLLVARNPDTIHFPSISYLTDGDRFAASDRIYIDSPPELVIEITATNRRRRGLAERVAAYHRWGVETVWIADPIEKQFHVVQPDRLTNSYTERESLPGGSIFSGFRVRVGDLFADPSWWK